MLHRLVLGVVPAAGGHQHFPMAAVKLSQGEDVR